MKNNDVKKLKKSALFTWVWVIAALLAMGGVTYAWFTFSSSTRVENLAGAVGSGGAELLISNYPNSDFSDTAELIAEGKPEDLQPVSTADLTVWSKAVSNDREGISNKFKDVSENINDMTLHGMLFLKAEGGSCDVYFNGDELGFFGDPQLVASCRMGITVATDYENYKKIFTLDSLNGDGAQTRLTMSEANVVIESTGDGGTPVTVPDPAQGIEEFCGYADDRNVYPGEYPICTLRDGEVAEVRFRIYMEGCDENCFNEAQDKNLEFRMAFVGCENKDY